MMAPPTHCSHCGSSLVYGAGFCQRCGARVVVADPIALPNACRNCGATLDLNQASYCWQCGTPLPVAGAAPWLGTGAELAAERKQREPIYSHLTIALLFLAAAGAAVLFMLGLIPY